MQRIWKVSALAAACLVFAACGGGEPGAPDGTPLAVSPENVSLVAGATAHFTAAASGSSNATVSWTVQEGPVGGAVSSTGLYTAPSTSGTYHVVATSQADPTKTATATVSVSATAPPPTANPWPTTGTTQLYVSQSGSDSNPGTNALPFRTVSHAASVATAGTVVHVAPGTYGYVASTRSGTSSAPIVFVSDTKWGARIYAPGQVRAWMNTGDWVVIQGFEITGSQYSGITSTGSHGRFRGNHIHHMAPPDCSRGGAGIELQNYSETDNDSDGNVIHDINGGAGCGLIHGIYYQGPYGGRILNNVVYRTSGWGIHLYHNANHILIANNTVFQNGHSGIIVGASLTGNDVPPGIDSGTVVANNIVVGNSTGCIEENNSGRTYGNAYVDNTCYGNGGANAISLLPPPSGQSWSTVSGTLTSDPQFVNYQPDGSGDYRLRSSSPSANSGTSTGAPGYDIDLAARPRGSAIDRGAYESW